MWLKAYKVVHYVSKDETAVNTIGNTNAHIITNKEITLSSGAVDKLYSIIEDYEMRLQQQANTIGELQMLLEENEDV